jgi:hypothetical protein
MDIIGLEAMGIKSMVIEVMGDVAVNTDIFGLQVMSFVVSGIEAINIYVLVLEVMETEYLGA